MPQEQENHEEHLLSGKVLIITPLHKVPLIKTILVLESLSALPEFVVRHNGFQKTKTKNKTTKNFRETMRALRSRHLNQ